MTIAELSGGGGGGAKTIVCFPSMKNDIVIINLTTQCILGGSGGMLPQENFNVSTSETVSGGF